MTGITRALATAVAERVGTAPGCSWAGADGIPDGTGASTPVVLAYVPGEPDAVLTVTVVPMGDHPTLPLGQVLVQVRARGRRGRPLDAADLLDAVFDVLHGWAVEGDGWAVIQCLRQNRAPLGTDSNDRAEAADHYEVAVDYPATDSRPDGGAW